MKRLKNLLFFSGLYKDFIRGSDLTTLVTNIETMLMKSGFDWGIEYRPESKCYVIRIGGKKNGN